MGIYAETTEEQIASAINLLEERGYKINTQENFQKRGYHIGAHCFRTGKNESFKPKDGNLYKFGLSNNHFRWIRVARLEYQKPKKDYRAAAYEVLSGK